MKTALNAINKWLYFGWNYGMVMHSWTDYGNNECEKYVPRFLVEAKWTCNFCHMYDKWQHAVEKGNTDSFLGAFYANLDTENRIALLEWVMENYNDEMKLGL